MLYRLTKWFFNIPRFYKRLVSVLLDVLFIAVALFGALFIRVNKVEAWLSLNLFYALSVTILLTLVISVRLGLYRAVIRFIDTKALSTIFFASLASGLILVISSYVLKASMPRSIPFIYTPLLLILIGGSRLLVRGMINTQMGKSKMPVIIYGAGSSGRQLALSLQHGVEYNPIAFVDDNVALHHVLVAAIRVFPREKLVELIERHKVGKLLLAMPSASVNHKKKLLNQLEGLSVEVLTIPGSADLVSGKLQVDTLRKIDIIDLLDRETVKPIEGLFRRCINNKHVMVTGAGGSIGSELCRQIVQQGPLTLILFDASELALYEIEKELRESLAKRDQVLEIIPILANVMDKSITEQVIKRFSVDTIYHAAAYKHVPIVEYNVISGIRNNVWGTLNCAEIAIKCNVENFVLISTDKAVRPTNVMGASKRLAELVLQGLSEGQSKTRFSMVRFGNVLGSSGSVVPLFNRLIAEGGPVTITHKDITRYFMTIPEAAQLVIQAGAMGSGGEVYVLDMGKSVKINDLAKKMIHLSGLTVKSEETPNGDIEIVYTGLRPGEKLYEELLIGENVEGTEHRSILKARELSIPLDDLRKLLQQLKNAMDEGNIEQLRTLLLDAPLGYKPSSEIADCLWLAKSDAPPTTVNNPQGLRVV